MRDHSTTLGSCIHTQKLVLMQWNAERHPWRELKLRLIVSHTHSSTYWRTSSNTQNERHSHKQAPKKQTVSAWTHPNDVLIQSHSEFLWTISVNWIWSIDNSLHSTHVFSSRATNFLTAELLTGAVGAIAFSLHQYALLGQVVLSQLLALLCCQPIQSV